MRRGELIINGNDAWQEWRVVVGPGFSDAMLQTAAAKEAIQTDVRLEDGIRTVLGAGGVKVGAREITLEIGLRGRDRADFLRRWESFEAELLSGLLEIESALLPGRKIRCRYVSCGSFANRNGRMAKMMLKLQEMNPKNRK